MRRGTRVGQAYVAVTADGSGLNEEIVDSVDEAGPGVERAGDEAGKRYGDRFSARFRERLEGMRDRVADRLAANLGGAGDKAGARAGDSAGESFVDRLGEKVKDLGDRVGKELGDRLASRPEQVRRGISRIFDDEFAETLAAHFSDDLLGNLNVHLSGAAGENPLSRLFDRWMTEAVSGNTGGVVGRRGRTLGDRIGALLGAGSRNNVLNLFGRSIGNAIDLTQRFGSVLRGIPSLMSRFAAGFSQVSSSASVFSKIAGGLGANGLNIGKGLSSIAAAGPGAAVAIGVVVVAMSALASVLSALVGIVAALASTILSGLVGALTVASAGVLAVVAAGGLLTAAFMSMTDAQKDLLKSAFRPLREEMVGIGQVMLQDMIPAFGQWSKNLQDALYLVLPVAEQMGPAFADAGTSITAALSGPGFQLLSRTLAVELPTIVRELSSALGGFLNGFAGTLSAVMPLVTRFSVYLNDVATRFSTWASSVNGQTAIQDFVSRAVTSLQSLWNFTKSFFGYLSDVFFNPATQNAGNSIFDSMARTFEKMRASFARAAADGSLKRFFDDAIKFGGDLWATIESLFNAFKNLYDSGTLNAVGRTLRTFGDIVDKVVKALKPLLDILGWGLPHAAKIALGPLEIMANGVLKIADAFVWASERLRDFLNLLGLAKSQQGSDPGPNIPGSSQPGVGTGLKGLLGGSSAPGAGAGNPLADIAGSADFDINKYSKTVKELQTAGGKALAATNIPAPKEPKWKNPYVKWANSLIKDGPKIAAQVKNALLKVNQQIMSGVRDAAQSTDPNDVISSLTSLTESIRSAAEQTVNSAQSALNSAASSLASATSPKAAKKALREVKQAQKGVQRALRDQQAIDRASAMLAAQQVVNQDSVNSLLSGFMVYNATLADFATARAIIADRLDEANQKLAAAISLRDSYRTQIADSIKAFGALTTAQAQTINGVQQALSATDITSNLQDRLDKIRAFNDNLRLLLAQGLSEEAYKQIVDAGVEGGSAYAEALLQGGPASIGQVNQLVQAIGSAADGLGEQAANRMYQAGVDAAQGLVDGLTSLSAELDSAAASLGEQIALSIRRSLGIASPAKVLIADMDHVGDGAVIGLDNQHVKVGNAASRLAAQISVSPEVAAYASRQARTGDVSGNDPKFLWTGDIITPTEDPKAVAQEAINELVGRLP